MRDSDTCLLAISSVMCTKYTQNICIDIENNVSLQDNSDDPKRIKSKWRYAKNGKRMKQEPRGGIKPVPS